MKLSTPMIATAMVALMPLAAIAGDKDKTGAPMTETASKQFDILDTNRDGRISENEATSDSKIVFATADRNKDGFLDSSEYSHRDMPKQQP